MFSMFFLLTYGHSVKFTGVETFTAFDTGILINEVRLLALTTNTIHRTLTGTERTANTLVFDDGVAHQILTFPGQANFLSICSIYSSSKVFRAESTGFGAVCPNPQRLAFCMAAPIFSC
jgi:hypothetical protein